MLIFDKAGRIIPTMKGDVATFGDGCLLLNEKITGEALAGIVDSGAVDEATVLQCTHAPKLETLPPSLGRLRQLREVTLQKVPKLVPGPELWTLPALEVLFLAGLAPQADFADLQPMPRLRRLYVGSTKVTAFPESLGACEALEELNLDYLNALKSLPPNLGGLRSLRTLKVRSSKLARVPEGLGALAALTTLHISAPLTALPDLGGLTALEEIELICPGLKALPASFGRLPRLKRAVLTTETLTTLPDLSGLAALQHLDVQYCPALSLAPALAGLRALRQLSCRPSQVAALSAAELAAFGKRIPVDCARR